MTTRYCSRCNENFPLDKFYIRSNGSVSTYCRECTKKDNNERHHRLYKNDENHKARVRITGRKHYEQNRERANERTQHNHRQEREQVIQHYGGKCECCGENRYEFLAIDHINGGGSQHRQEVGNKMTRWLTKNNFPSGFRVLCHNCNMAIAFYGICPHQKEEEILNEIREFLAA